jgi:hypothetical protein
MITVAWYGSTSSCYICMTYMYRYMSSRQRSIFYYNLVCVKTTDPWGWVELISLCPNCCTDNLNYINENKVRYITRAVKIIASLILLSRPVTRRSAIERAITGSISPLYSFSAGDVTWFPWWPEVVNTVDLKKVHLQQYCKGAILVL